MAFLGYSNDLELDDDGILRDSFSSGGLQLDDEGIVRDDFDVFSKHTTNTHWTDSGLGADKQSAGSSSTLRQLDLQSYPSFDDLSHDQFEEETNISDLEASKDDLSFEQRSVGSGFDDLDLPHDSSDRAISKHSTRTNDNSFDHSLNFHEFEDEHIKSKNNDDKDLFDNDYFKQLQDFGVLIDDSELSNPKNSLNEFEKLETNFSTENLAEFEKNDNVDVIGEFLKRDIQSPSRESDNGDFLQISGHHTPNELEETRSLPHTRPNTADSARTISSRSFPEISPEEALQYFNEQIQQHEQDKVQLVDNDAASIEFESAESQKTGDDDVLFLITGPMTDLSPSVLVPAYDNINYEPLIAKNSPILRRHIQQSFIHHNESNQDSSFDVNNTFEDRPTNPLGFVSMSYDDNDSEDSRDITPTGDIQQSFHLDLSLDNKGILNNIESRPDSCYSESGSLTPVSVIHSDPKSPSGTTHQSQPDTTSRHDYETSDRSTVSESPITKSTSKSEEVPQKMSKARSQESFFEANKPLKTEKSHKRLLPKPTVSDTNQSFRVKSKSTTNISRSGPVKPTHMSLSEISGLNMEEIDADQTEPVSTASDKSRGELSSKLNQEFHKRKQATELVQQLQVDYDKLLSKYALAELTIDQLRLGAKITLHSDSPTPSQATSGSLPLMQHPVIGQFGQTPSRAVILSPYQALTSPFSPTSDTTVGDATDGRLSIPIPAQRLEMPKGAFIGDNSSLPRSADFNVTTGTDAEDVREDLLFQAQNLDERINSFKAVLDEGIEMEEQEKEFDKIRTDHEELRNDYLTEKERYNVLKRSTTTMSEANFDEDKELEGDLFKLGMKFDEVHEKMENNRKQRSAQRLPFQTGKNESESGSRPGSRSASRAGTRSASLAGSGSDDPRAVDHMKKILRGTRAGDDLVQPKHESEFDNKVKHLQEEYNALIDRYRRLKEMAQTTERDQEIDNLVRKLKHICEEAPDVFRMPAELQHRWEKLQQEEQKEKMENGARGHNSYQAKVVGQSTSVKDEDCTDRQERHLSGSDRRGYDKRHVRHRGMDDSLSGSRSSLPSSVDSSNPNLPRPRRHNYPDGKGRLKKRRDSGSLSSLQDSGISEQEGATANGGVTDPLSKLPGPGKFKQMTGRRSDVDADSGFIGSMVGSEVSQRSENGRLQPTLRLRSQEIENERSKSHDEPPSRVRESSDSDLSRVDTKTPVKPGRAPLRQRHEQAVQSADYTDSSYTLTESDMSFEAEAQRKLSKGKQGRGRTERTIEELSEEELSEKSETIAPLPTDFQRGIPHTVDLSWLRRDRPSTKQSHRSKSSYKSTSEDDRQTPIKSKLQQKSRTHQRFSQERESDITSMSTDQDTQDTPHWRRGIANRKYSSEEEENMVPKPYSKPSESVQPSDRSLDCSQAIVEGEARSTIHRPPTPGSIPYIKQPLTPVRLELGKFQKPASPARRGSEDKKQKEVEERGVGMDSDSSLLQSDAETAATKGSRGSATGDRLRQLQDDLANLRGEFIRANQKQPQPVQAPPPQPTTQQTDYYFDPTEDPYAFMMGPRRRANSFSGTPMRDWNDIYWRMPNTQHDDIPLGYAAVDAYASPATRHVENLNEPINRSRTRHKIRRRYPKHDRVRDAETVDPTCYDSDQSPTRTLPRQVTEPVYYFPAQASATQTTGAILQQGQAPAMYLPQRNDRRYVSQPDLATVNVPVSQPGITRQPDMGRSYEIPTPPSAYSTSRSSYRHNPYTTMQVPYQTTSAISHRTHSLSDLRLHAQPTIYQPEVYVPAAVPQTDAEAVYAVETSDCRHCNGTGAHTHGQYVYPVINAAPLQYVVTDSQQTRPRRRSRAPPRVRRYSLDGYMPSRYLVRQSGSDDERSMESEDEIVVRRSRKHRRRGRKYRRVRDEEYFSDRESLMCRDLDGSLNDSLHLANEIEHMTKRMIKKTDSELTRSKKWQEFGSSL